MSAARRIRLLALGLLCAFVLFTAALLGLPWLVGEPLPVVRPDGRVTLAADGPGGRVGAELRVDAAGGFVLVFDLAAPPSRMPAVVLTMPHEEVQADPPQVERIGGGRFRVNGYLQAPGQWQVRIDAGPRIHELDFVLAEF